MHHLKALFLVVVLTLPAKNVLACLSDMECKGERICSAGQCVDPGTSTPATSPKWKAPAPAEQSWASDAALYGFIGAGATLGLAIASYSTWEDTGTSIALGSVATLVGGITGPITAAGADSARAHGARGNPVLQNAGWVAYTLSMLNAVTLIALSAADESPAGWLTLTTGSMGAMGLAFFAADAQAAANDLKASAPNANLQISPWVSPWVTQAGNQSAQATGAVAGVDLRF